MQPSNQTQWRQELERARERWGAWFDHVDTLLVDAEGLIRAEAFDRCEAELDAVEALILMGPEEQAK
jgi:DNA-binding PadR family transcriptional regulator